MVLGLNPTNEKGQALQDLSPKNGCKIVLRTARWGDLDDLLGFINSLVVEMIDIKEKEAF